MMLRSRLETVVKTVQEMEFAAEAMYHEGKFRLQKRHQHAAIYLLGYAAEMWLKCAYFQLRGAALLDPVEPFLAPARTRGRSLTPAVPHEGYHSLLLWSRLIEEEWTVQGKILPAGFVLEFQNEVVALYGMWWVEMRYRQPIVATAEAERFLRGVAWLRTNYTKLWS